MLRAGAAGSQLVEEVGRDLALLPRPLALYLVGEVRGVHRVLASPQRAPLTQQVR